MSDAHRANPIPIALAVGFFDQSHFHHGFRQAFGLTPADYRQQMLPS